jgi:hypothetical protein
MPVQKDQMVSIEEILCREVDLQSWRCDDFCPGRWRGLLSLGQLAILALHLLLFEDRIVPLHLESTSQMVYSDRNENDFVSYDF